MLLLGNMGYPQLWFHHFNKREYQEGLDSSDADDDSSDEESSTVFFLCVDFGFGNIFYTSLVWGCEWAWKGFTL